MISQSDSPRLTGEFPFQSEVRTDLYRSIALGSAVFPDEIWEQITPQAKDLVSRLLGSL